VPAFAQALRMDATLAPPGDGVAVSLEAHRVRKVCASAITRRSGCRDRAALHVQTPLSGRVRGLYEERPEESEVANRTIAERILDGLASVRLAVLTMAALAVVCTAATLHESRFGAAAAQREFYGTTWFALLLSLLGANVLFSMLKRWPWRLHHAGFVTAHVGILLLLVGSLFTLRFGIDGRLALVEGDSASEIALPQRTLSVSLPRGESKAIPLGNAGEFWGEDRYRLAPELELVLTRHQPHVAYREHLQDGPGGAPLLEYHLEGGFGRQDGALLADDPGRHRAEFGPIHFVFARAADAQARERLLVAGAGQSQAVFVADAKGQVHYALSSRKGSTARGIVDVGKPIPTPWMDLTLVVDAVRPSVRVERHLAAQKPPSDEAQRLPAVEVRVDAGGTAGEPAWIAWGEERAFSAGAGATARVAFADARSALPFRLTLLDFESKKYPGTAMPASYESRVRVDDPERGSFEALIAMNRPLHHRGYTLFQSSFAEGERMTSVLAVSRAPGLPLVYAGTALLLIGVAWMFYVKPWLARRRGAHALARLEAAAAAQAPALLLALLFAGSAAPVAAADPWRELRALPVQDGGRVKPLDTFAREAARRIAGARAFGAESVAGLDPVEWLVALQADPSRWQSERLVRVSDASLRALIQLPPDRDRFSLAELAANERFIAIAEQARRSGSDERLSPEREAAVRLYGDLSLLGSILAGAAPRVAPGGVADAWRSFHDLREARDEAGGAAHAQYRALLVAYAGGSKREAAAAARRLRESLGTLQEGPPVAAIAREVHYNTLKPFRWASLLYLAALLVLLAGFSLRGRRLALLGYGALVTGFAFHSYGFVLRTLIAERAPVANMYESIVFAAWGAVLFALVFEAQRWSGVFAACAAAVAVPFLLIADNVPIFDAAIDPLAPVLRDNFWLTTHVLTITLGYAALFLALALGHVSLGLILWRAGEAKLRSVSGFCYGAMQAGTLLLAAGTLLGGVWASYSWGRFWGWDPKETWALIALLVYLAILHARFVGWIRDLGLAIGSILGGLSVVMAWYGVNYVLGTGLHSYGFGSGGLNTWVLAYVAAEVVIVVAAASRRRASGVRQPVPEAAAAR
jgi:ABC-type transport system involved in cytochrome c biogenesis permease subunit